MSQDSTQGYYNDFKGIQDKWEKWRQHYKWESDDVKTFHELCSREQSLFNAMIRRITAQSENLEHAMEQEARYLRQIEQLKDGLQELKDSKDAKIQELQVALQDAQQTRESLHAQLAGAVSNLALANRAPGTVYTAGKTFQPITVGRDYREFIEQTLPGYQFVVFKHLQELSSAFSEQTRAKDTKNLFLSFLTKELFASDPASMLQRIYLKLNLPEVLFSADLLKKLAKLHEEAQELTAAIAQSGGTLLFAEENEPLNPICHELASGSPDSETILYTVTPAYIMKLANQEELTEKDVIFKARVVTTQASTPPQTATLTQ